MSREKQIEEMIKELCAYYGTKCGGCGCKPCAIIEHCKALYNAGYRKQSVVIEEYRKKVYSKMEKYTVFGREYIQRIMRETEKEMKGGAE